MPTAGPLSPCTTTASPARGVTSDGQIVGDEGLRPPDGLELHRHDPHAVGPRHNSSTSQSATSLDAGVALERHERLDRRRQTRECRGRPGTFAVKPLERGPDVGIGQPAGVAARRQQARRRAAATPSRADERSAGRDRPRRRRRCWPADPSLLRSAAADRASTPRAPEPARPRRAPARSRRRWLRARGQGCRRPPRQRRGQPSRSGRVRPARRRSRSATSGRKRRRGQRERTVGSSTSGRAVTRMNTDNDGGSSSVFSSAFCAAGTSASASSMMTTRRRPSNGRYAARSTTSRTCSILIEPVSPGSSTRTSGWTPRAMRVQAAHVPQASSGTVHRADGLKAGASVPERPIGVGAGLGVRRLETVERLRQGGRREALPDASGPGKDQARRQRVACDRSRQQRDDSAMTDDVSKWHGVRGQVSSLSTGDLSRASYHASSSCCPFAGRRRATRNRVFRSRSGGGGAIEPTGRLRGASLCRSVVVVGRAGWTFPRRRWSGSAPGVGASVLPGGCSATRPATVPKARRVHVAVLGRLGAAREVLGVDHRPRLDLIVLADNLDMLAPFGCELAGQPADAGRRHAAQAARTTRACRSPWPPS